ncbi:MAG: hypothetical protein AAB794_02035, partial [Patescibacteria group bacterium]
SNSFDELGFPGDEKPPALTKAQEIKRSYRQEYLNSLTDSERSKLKWMDAFDFLAGLPGNTTDKRAEEFRKEKHERILEAKGAVEATVKGARLVRGLKAEQQAEAAKLYGDTLPAEFRAFFEKLVTTGDGQEVVALGDPRVFAMLLQVHSGDREKALLDLADHSKVKTITETLDTQDIPKIRAKLDLMQKMPGFEQWRAKPKKSFEDLRRENDQVQDPRYKLSEGELATLERNDKKILPAYGIFTGEMLAKRLEEGPKKDVEDRRARIQLDIAAGKDIPDVDRKFLDELNKADPIIQLRRDILGGKDTSPPAKTAKPKLSREAALKKLLDAPENAGFTADSPAVKEALKRYGY